jgi:hypothetical protein
MCHDHDEIMIAVIHWALHTEIMLMHFKNYCTLEVFLKVKTNVSIADWVDS